MAVNKFHKLDEKLRQKESKLSYLLDITNAINSNSSVEKLLQLYEFILREQLDVARVLLFYKSGDEGWNCTLKFGYKGRAKDIMVQRDLQHIKDITVIESSSKDSMEFFDVVIPVYHKTDALAFLLLGDEDEDELGVSPSITHMPFIQTLTNIIIVAIENKRMARERLAQERIRKELEVASEMQNLLFPRQLPDNNRIQIAAQYQTHSMVGGDYYDYIELNDQEFCICMADVSGKGVSAAILMSNFQANLRAILNYNRFPLPRLIRELNRRVYETAEGEKFITVFIGIYNAAEREMRYVNAGHNPPLLTDSTSAQWLFSGCTGLGMFEKLPSVEEGHIRIVPNSILTLFTDGVVDLENDKGEHFETENLKRIIRENFNVAMKEVNRKLFEGLHAFKGEQPYVDDTAVLSCRFY
jgi:sigma-B regulation protein RsbU (phosphoserine phosphatase)